MKQRSPKRVTKLRIQGPYTPCAEPEPEARKRAGGLGFRGFGAFQHRNISDHRVGRGVPGYRRGRGFGSLNPKPIFDSTWAQGFRVWGIATERLGQPHHGNL